MKIAYTRPRHAKVGRVENNLGDDSGGYRQVGPLFDLPSVGPALLHPEPGLLQEDGLTLIKSPAEWRSQGAGTALPHRGGATQARGLERGLPAEVGDQPTFKGTTTGSGTQPTQRHRDSNAPLHTVFLSLFFPFHTHIYFYLFRPMGPDRFLSNRSWSLTSERLIH